MAAGKPVRSCPACGFPVAGRRKVHAECSAAWAALGRERRERQAIERFSPDVLGAVNEAATTVSAASVYGRLSRMWTTDGFTKRRVRTVLEHLVDRGRIHSLGTTRPRFFAKRLYEDSVHAVR